MGTFLGLLFGIGAFAGYLLPALIAGLRRHHNEGAIFVLNLLLGWTFLGWVAALVWACTAIDAAQPEQGDAQ